LIEINSDKDHIHILLSFSPRYSISKVVEIIKSNSSKIMFEKYNSYLRRFYWYKNTLWSRSYFVATHGKVTSLKIKEYIKDRDDS
jgi:putative transposase